MVISLIRHYCRGHYATHDHADNSLFLYHIESPAIFIFSNGLYGSKRILPVISLYRANVWCGCIW